MNAASTRRLRQVRGAKPAHRVALIADYLLIQLNSVEDTLPLQVDFLW